MLQWYALSTRSRHEKAVAEELTRRQLEVFLPLREVLSQWKDRRKLVQLPLFPGSVFVRRRLMQKGEVLRTRGVVGLVRVSGVPAPMAQYRVTGDTVRQVCRMKLSCDPSPSLTEGEWVRVIRGPLSGLTGFLIPKVDLALGKPRPVLRLAPATGTYDNRRKSM